MKGRYGYTLPEVLVGTIALLIIIAGVYLFLSRNTETLFRSEAKRRLNQKIQTVQQALTRELNSIGINPKKTPFELLIDPGIDPGDTYIDTLFKDCSTLPLYDPLEVKSQICFGITDARYYKLGFATDSNGDGLVSGDEAKALLLRNRTTSVVHDPRLQDGSDSTPPDYLSGTIVDISNMSPAPAGIVFDPAGDGSVTLPNLPSLPRLCELVGGSTFSTQYDLILRTYDGTPDRLLANNILCFGVAYFRPYTEYESCLACTALNGGLETPVAKPAACSTMAVDEPLPFDYFRSQNPLLSQQEADNGLVFLQFPTNINWALNPDEAYNTYLIKLALLLEDSKLKRGYVNPLTNRPYETALLEIDFYIPEANLPCNANLGSCTFNNAQCDK